MKISHLVGIWRYHHGRSWFQHTEYLVICYYLSLAVIMVTNVTAVTMAAKITEVN